MTTSQTPFSFPEDKAESIWLRVGTLIDGVSDLPVKHANVVFNSEDILFVGTDLPPTEHLSPGQTEPHADLPDAALLPGLIEGHSHVFLEGAELDFQTRKTYQSQSPEDLFRLAQDRVMKLPQTGVIAMRDGGDKDRVGLSLSAQYKNGRPTQMPCVDSPGPAFHHQGRYGSFIGGTIEEHATPEAAVNARIEEGADHIKVVPTGIINFKRGRVTAPPQMTADEVRAFVTASNTHGKQVMAHASGTEGVENAIQGGVDTVEHGFFLTSEQLKRMRDQNIAWVPTFIPVQVQVDEADKMGWTKKIVANLQKILDDHAARLREAETLGVTVIAGSDAGSCGVPHGLGLLHELELMEQAGYSTMATLKSATGTSASRLAFKEPIGKIAAGQKSRMMLTQYDPLKTVSNLTRDKYIIFNGTVQYVSENIDFEGF